MANARNIPANAEPVTLEGLPESAGIAYIFRNPEGSKYPLAYKVYRGKSGKPWRFFAARTDEEARRNVNQALVELKESHGIAQARKAKEKEDKAAINAATDTPPGTVMVHSWGWEQTNLDWFKVTRVLSRTRIEVVPIGAKSDGTSHGMHAMSENQVADPERVIGEPMKVALTSRNAFKVPGTKGYRYGGTAHVWDGSPMYCSWYA